MLFVTTTDLMFTKFFACRNQSIDHDAFLFLVNPGAHWLSVVANLKLKHCFAIESLIGVSTMYSILFCHVFKLISACFTAANTAVELDEWKFSLCTDVPQQENSFDCGIRAIVNTFCLLNELPHPKMVPSEQCRNWVAKMYLSAEDGKNTSVLPEKLEISKNEVRVVWNSQRITVEFSRSLLWECVHISLFRTTKNGPLAM